VRQYTMCNRVQRAGLAGAMRVLEQRLGDIFAAASRTALAAYTRRLATSVGPPPQLPAAALAALRGSVPTPRAPQFESCPASLPYPPYPNPNPAPSNAAGGICGAGVAGTPIQGGLTAHGRPRTVTVSMDVVSEGGADSVRIILAEAGERGEAAAARPTTELLHHRCVAASQLRSAGLSLNEPAPTGAAVYGARSGVHPADMRRSQLVEGKISRPDPAPLHSATSWQSGWQPSASARAAGQPAFKSTLMELLADGLAPDDAAAHSSSQPPVPAMLAAPALQRLSKPEPLPEHVQPLLPRVVSELPVQSAPRISRHIALQPAVPAAPTPRAEKVHLPMPGTLVVDSQTAADRAALAEKLHLLPAQKLHSPPAQKLHLPMRGAGPPARARGAAPQSLLGFLFERQHRPAAARAAPGALAPAGPVGGEAAMGLTAPALPGRVSQGLQAPVTDSQVAAAGKRTGPVLADPLASARPAVQALPVQALTPVHLATCDTRPLLPALALRCRAPAATAGPCREMLTHSLVSSMSGAGSDLSEAAAPCLSTGMQTGDVAAEPVLRAACSPSAAGSAGHGVAGCVVPATARAQVQRPGVDASAGSPDIAKSTACASAPAPAASAAAADVAAAGTMATPGEPAAAVAAMVKMASTDMLLSTVLQTNSVPAAASKALRAMPPGRPDMQAVAATHGRAVASHSAAGEPLASTPPKGLAGVAAAAGRAPASALAATAAASVAAGGLRTAAGPFPWPAYFIGTRDSFTHRLVPLRCEVNPAHVALILCEQDIVVSNCHPLRQHQ